MATRRFKCTCGHVFDGNEMTTSCSKCGQPFDFNNMGILHIYRMGSPIGVAVGLGIYLNQVAFGHVGNKQSVDVYVPYGSYKLHCALGMARKCNDLNVDFSDAKKEIYIKSAVKAGFWTNKIVLTEVSKEEMPVN